MAHTTDSRLYDEYLKIYPNAKRILAEGDSWFAYPRRYIMVGEGSNIIDHLGKKKDVVIYNTSSNGDEVMSMLSGDQKFSLIKRLAHNEFDFLLFSGGGNDMVGRYDFDFFIKENTGGLKWQECINEERIEYKATQIKATYEILCEMVKDYSKNDAIKIVTHTYDDIRPDKEGFELFDLIPLGSSWIYPYLMEKNIKNSKDQKSIVNHLLGKFRSKLFEVEQKHNNLIVVDTQGTVGAKEWRDEIHPTPSGFKKLAEKIYKSAIK